MQEWLCDKQQNCDEHKQRVLLNLCMWCVFQHFWNTQISSDPTGSQSGILGPLEVNKAQPWYLICFRARNPSTVISLNIMLDESWFICVFVCICLRTYILKLGLRNILPFCFVAGIDMRRFLTVVDVTHLALVKKSLVCALCACMWGARSLRCLLLFYFYLSSLCTVCQNKHALLWNARSMTGASSMSVFQGLHPASKTMMISTEKISEGFLGVFSTFPEGGWLKKLGVGEKKIK